MKSKIFFGRHYATSADALFNNWREENPNARILKFEYQQVDKINHSICILYEDFPSLDERVKMFI